MPSTLSRDPARGEGWGGCSVERGVRYSRNGVGKFSGRIRWLGLNLRASGFGVSSVWMKIVRLEEENGDCRAFLRVGRVGFKAWWRERRGGG